MAFKLLDNNNSFPLVTDIQNFKFSVNVLRFGFKEENFNVRLLTAAVLAGDCLCAVSLTAGRSDVSF